MTNGSITLIDNGFRLIYFSPGSFSQHPAWLGWVAPRWGNSGDSPEKQQRVRWACILGQVSFLFLCIYLIFFFSYPAPSVLDKLPLRPGRKR